MELKLHYEILDKSRRSLLPRLAGFKDNFYLAGGTALALQLGHRDSIDFDFFTSETFDSELVYQQIEALCGEQSIEKTQQVLNTLSVIIGGRIKLSFFKLPYRTVLPFIETEHLNILQAKEIAVMKLIALLRATYRDYVDMYYLLKIFTLEEIFALAKRKYQNFDAGVYIKCLLSYSDVEITPVKFKRGFELTPKKTFSFIEAETKWYLAKMKQLNSHV